MEIINTFMNNFIDMFISMSFYIVLGLLCVGVLNTYVDKEKILKHLGKNKFSSVVKASVIGVPLPLCSCGVVPTAVELKKSGASNGAVTSFLISTPQTGIDSMLATYSMMGMLMAIFRPIAAFASGIIGGGMVNLFAKNDIMNMDSLEPSSCCSSTPSSNGCCGTEPVEESACCCGSEPVEESTCCCGSEPVEESTCCCATEAVEESTCCSASEPVEVSSCCGGGNVVQSHNKFLQVFKYAFGKFLDDIAVHFLVGMFIATIISTFLPVDFFVNIGLDKGVLAMLAVVLVGLPMYICSTASIPIALSLVAKGLSYGSAFAFLFTGPVTNIASLLVLGKALGRKITAMYIGAVVVCSIFFGFVLDFILDTFDLEISGMLACHTDHHSPFSSLVAVIFAVLVIRSVCKQKLGK